jgi:tetratricopeptide (TPR) repeat protein
MKKIIFLYFFCFFSFVGISQTDKYTEKLQKLYAAEQYYKVIDYKSGNESEMSSISLYIKGMAHFKVRGYKRAIGYFDDAIAQGDPLADMYYYKGVCHLFIEQFSESAAALTIATEMEPDEAIYAEFLGVAYFYLEKYDTAIVWIEKSMSLEKGDASLYSLLADCHFKLKQYDEAAAAYQIAYQKSDKVKDKKIAHYYIAEAQFLSGQFDLAKETLNAHLIEFKNDYNAVSLLIQTHYALKDLEAAKPLIDKMNSGKKTDSAFPNSLRNKFGIDRFELGGNEVNVYQAFEDQSGQIYFWKHQFAAVDTEGEERYTVETLLDSTAGNENTYLICKIQGDSLFKYGSVVYDENFNYFNLKETVQKIISGEIESTELVTGYKDWYAAKKKAKTGGVGDSFETAIVIGSVPDEYAYLRENYPGYQFIMQSLVFENGVPYDILKFKTADGEVMEIYFNISSFFGKY